VAAAPAEAHYGKFVCTEKLGAGGMGEVWKAWDGELSRWVALKFLRGGDADEIARFKREAHLAGKLSHPNIAAIHDVGEANGRHFIAMQFIDGRTLSRRPARQAAELVRQAALAVHYAHAQGVVHRDLKPANIMAVGSHAYVMDFGLAKATSVGSSLSASGLLVGTPAYMSPEQARGARVDARGDVYSLGATLYEALSGAAPFVGDDVLSILVQVAEAEPASLPVDRDLQTIVMKCLEKEAGRRYATAQALADDLGQWLAGEPIEARAASALGRAWRRMSRHRMLLAGAMVVVAAGVAWRIVEWRRVARVLEGARRLEAEGKLAEARDAYRSLPGNAEAEAGFRRADERLRTGAAKQGVEAVLARWAKLEPELARLEANWASSVIDDGTRATRAAELMKPFEDFVRESPSDERSRAAATALAGWARWLAGPRDDGVRMMREGAPIGCLVEIVARLVDLMELAHGYWQERGADGVRVVYAESAVKAMRPVAAKLRPLLEEAGRGADATGWVQAFAHVVAGAEALSEDRCREAVEAFTLALESPVLRPWRGFVVAFRARARMGTRDYRGAEGDMREFMRLRPESDGGPGTLARMRLLQSYDEFMSRRDPRSLLEESLALFGEAMRLARPEWWWWATERSQAYEQLAGLERGAGRDGRPWLRLALADLERAHAIADVFLRRGDLHRMMGDLGAERNEDPTPEYQKALTDFELLSQALPRSPLPYTRGAHLHLAVAGRRRSAGEGDWRTPVNLAMTAVDAALSMDADDWSAHYLRGMALEHLGRTEEAIAEYERAVQLSPEAALARERLEKLKSK
jgi:tetratricopeptide (TPR) repeat protein/predicted Ser/Thr protein kinase